MEFKDLKRFMKRMNKKQVITVPITKMETKGGGVITVPITKMETKGGGVITVPITYIDNVDIFGRKTNKKDVDKKIWITIEKGTEDEEKE